MKVSITLKDDRLKQLIGKMETLASGEPVRTVVEQNTKRLMKQAYLNAEPGGIAKVANLPKTRPGKIFVKGYSGGAIRDSLRQYSVKTAYGMIIGQVGTNVSYAPYVEYGTRYMTAEPFLKPAFDQVSEKFKSDIDKLTRI